MRIAALSRFLLVGHLMSSSEAASLEVIWRTNAELSPVNDADGRVRTGTSFALDIWTTGNSTLTQCCVLSQFVLINLFERLDLHKTDLDALTLRRVIEL